MGLKSGVDFNNLEESGWGVIFATDADPAVAEALQPLLQLRQRQAGSRYHVFYQETGFQVGKDTKNSFLAKNNVGPGPADPDRVPYYLMIVGSPEQIPYGFQKHLDVRYAVGRIYFESHDEYAAYAKAAVAAETEPPASARMAFFGVTNPDDRHTRITAKLLVSPLIEALTERYPQWTQQKLVDEYATKAALLELLGANAPPRILFCAGHGISFPPGDPRQEAHQGALLCADWPGPAQWTGPVSPEMYFSADDLTSEMNLAGTIVFLWNSYGAGTPQFGADHEKRIAFRSFLAQLPMKLLGKPQGALAVVGPIDSMWGYASQPETVSQLDLFQLALSHLLEGHSLGYALECFNEHYAELSSTLSSELEDIEFGKRQDNLKLASLWTANNDARNIFLLGDPAVRLTSRGTR